MKRTSHILYGLYRKRYGARRWERVFPESSFRHRETAATHWQSHLLSFLPGEDGEPGYEYRIRRIRKEKS